MNEKKSSRFHCVETPPAYTAPGRGRTLEEGRKDAAALNREAAKLEKGFTSVDRFYKNLD